MSIRTSFLLNLIVALGVIFICFTCCNAKTPKPTGKPGTKGKPQPQRQSHVRGDEDIMVGQVPIKNGTVRLFENAKLNGANLSRTATYDEEEDYVDYGGGEEGEGEPPGPAAEPINERDRESPSCHSDKNVGGCQRSGRERRYYYSKHRGCLRFRGCPGVGGNNYKSLHACQTECGRGGKYEGYGWTGDYDYYGGVRRGDTYGYRTRGYRRGGTDYGRPYYY